MERKSRHFLLLFLSVIGRETMGFTAETRGCLKAKLRPFLHEGVDVRTDVPLANDFLRTKISWMHRLADFLTLGAALRERAPLLPLCH